MSLGCAVAWGWCRPHVVPVAFVALLPLILPTLPCPHPPSLPAHIVQDFLQVLSMFNALDFHWPPSVKETYNVVSLANFNLELTAPECSVKLGFETKWCDP